MMGVPAPMVLTIPPEPEMNTSRPVTGRTLQGFTGALNHLAAVRGRHWHPVHAFSPAWPDADEMDTGYVHNVEGEDEVHHIIIPTSPLSRHVGLHILAAARAHGGSSDPSVTVSLETASGTTVDPGVQWLRRGGTFPARQDSYPTFLSGRRWRLPAVALTTGGVAQDSLVAGGVATAPRLLSLEDKAGDVLVLHVITVSAFVLSLTAWEWPEPEVNP